MSCSDRCCICGIMRQSYHNPEPIRDGAQDCCDLCNRLVVRARMRYNDLPQEEQEAFVLQLRQMAYHQLLEMFGRDL